ncbi:MAG: Riboflavin kinase [Methanomassiliicoccales archaeon PtaU1.Bin124]|nr:MAG: Riboflavin kinase [Methanomassiliicoccales archaeon PtaU1.Bin124]
MMEMTQAEGDEKFILALRRIALMGGMHDYVVISSRELGELLAMSQQSASKRILELLDAELISRDLGARRQRIRLTQKGIDLLRKEYTEYQRIFEMRDEVVIKGIVVTGMGEGQYYVTQPGYQEQFTEKLGFTPYEGTLNVKVPASELHKVQTMKKAKPIVVRGFERNGRTFGDVECHKATIQNIECAVVVPTRSHYDDVLEILCKYHLRRTLSINDGDEVEVRVSLV